MMMMKKMDWKGRMILVILSLTVILLTLCLWDDSSSSTSSFSSTFTMGRRLLQIGNTNSTSSNFFSRVDPLDDFKKYKGGFNITNKHYWSSTIFTGVYGYAIGTVWLLSGLIYGLFLLVAQSCCRTKRVLKKKKKPYCNRRHCYVCCILIVFFTILTIVASGLVLGGNVKFHSRAEKVVGIIVGKANTASETIYNTAEAMKNVNVNLQLTNSSSRQAFSFIDSTSKQLDSQAAEIQRHAKKNRHLINKGLKLANILTVLVVSLSMAALLALPVLQLLKLRRTLYLLLILCWMLTVISWLSFGAYFSIHKFAGDACTAFEDFQQDPYNNSLSSILPCGELRSAKQVLTGISSRIYNLVNQVNLNISRLHGEDFIQVCNPFSAPPNYQYEPDSCPPKTIKIGAIPGMLRALTCSELTNGKCLGGLDISRKDFQTVEAYSSSIQTLLDAYPGMESLLNCESVKDAFTEILQDHCDPLKRYIRMVWAALVFLSIVMVALVLAWIAKAHHEKKIHFANASVKPHSVTANVLESGIAKSTKDDYLFEP
ncbi:uncharacterized protein LOC124939482 [Impatiens glandulifera]|uniref:uncharacterized protein LOC124939482 n=1 Tax=Impatiens glandulifera TaxID=253017 RepID=UPI001FB08273|nr:uncharacterized protein LOC124939482 [Impatiens glandulifera]